MFYVRSLATGVCYRFSVMTPEMIIGMVGITQQEYDEYWDC